MDSELLAELWDKLPEEIQDKIIAHIPSPTLFALRSVCKHWEGLIHCLRFVRLRGKIPQQRPWILVPRQPSSLGFLAFVPECRRWIELPCGMSGSNLYAESMSAGDTKALLLFSTPRYTFPQRLLVCSPLLRLCTQSIDCTSSSCSMATGTALLLCQSNNGTVTGVAAVGRETDTSPLTAMCYDSCSQVWIPGGELPRDVKLAAARSSLLIREGSHGSHMLLLGERQGKQAIFVYGFADRKWVQIDLPDGSVELSNWVIGSNTGSSVYLVQLSPVGLHIAIWQLHVAARKKEERWTCERQQQRVDTRFIQEEEDEDDLLPPTKKAVVDDCILLESQIVVCSFPYFWCFDLTSKLWEWLPRCPPEVAKSSVSSRVFAYDPILVAHVIPNPVD